MLEWVEDVPIHTADQPLILKEPKRSISLPDHSQSGIRVGQIQLLGFKPISLAVTSFDQAFHLWVNHDNGDGWLTAPPEVVSVGRGSGKTLVRARSLPEQTRGALSLPVEISLTTDEHGEISGTYRLDAYRLGWIEFDGILRKLVIYDGDANGRLGDPRDHYAIDLDGDENCRVRVLRYSDFPEWIEPNSPFRVGNEGWVLSEVASDGSSATFSQVQDLPEPRQYLWVSGYRIPPGWVPKASKWSLEQLAGWIASEKQKEAPQLGSLLTQIGSLGTPESFDWLVQFEAPSGMEFAEFHRVKALGHPNLLRSRGDQLLSLASQAEGVSKSYYALALNQMNHPERLSFCVKGLREPNNPGTRGLAEILSDSDDLQTRKALLEVMRDSSDAKKRLAVYKYGLSERPGGPTVSEAKTAALDPDDDVAAVGIRDLFRLRHPDAIRMATARAHSRPQSEEAVFAIAEVLGSSGSASTAEGLIELLSSNRLTDRARAALERKLSLFRNADGLQQMVNGLQSERAALRQSLARALSSVASPEVRIGLLEAAKVEADLDVLTTLLESLAEHVHSSVTQLLQKHATTQSDRDLRTAAFQALATQGFDGIDEPAVLLEWLASEDWRDRVEALITISTSVHPKVAVRVVENLHHSNWRVRLYAVEAMIHWDGDRAIPQWIAQLESEEHFKVREALERALGQATGKPFGTKAHLWRSWWNEERVELGMDIRTNSINSKDYRDSRTTLQELIGQSKGVVFLLDRSSSMSAEIDRGGEDRAGASTRMTVAQTLLRELCDCLEDRTKVNVVAFGGETVRWKEESVVLGPLRDELSQFVRSLKVMPGVGSPGTLLDVMKEESVDTVVLITDGGIGWFSYPNPEGRHVWTDAQVASEVTQANRWKRVSLHALVIDSDSKVLRLIAQSNGGRYSRH